MQGGGGRRSSGKSNVTGSSQAQLRGPVDPGFTMAEILLSLTIIGVVAAITLPSLTGNINERTWNTQRKALYARMSQAMALMPHLNNHGKVTTEFKDGDFVVLEDTAAETFVTELGKVMKFTNTCAYNELDKCGINSTFHNMGGESVTLPEDLGALINAPRTETGVQVGIIQKTKPAAFETENGQSVAVYYNPMCQNRNSSTVWVTYGENGKYETTPDWGRTQPYLCANFIYDLNGKKGPNTMGKDIGFMTVLYATDPLFLAPNPIAADTGTNTYRTQAAKKCRDLGADYRLPNADELTSMYYNRKFLNIKNNYYWSSITSGPDANWALEMGNGTLVNFAHPNTALIRCLKR